MRTRTTLTAAALLAVGFLLGWLAAAGRQASHLYAQDRPPEKVETGKLPPLPDKLPAGLEARVGKVVLDRGLPTKKGVEQLWEVQDFQRATQLYQWAIPAIGTMGWHRASLANGK